jgi:rhodanese-related sulfurtransferase
MIREISREHIDIKTAQGERVVLVEALPATSYERAHIPGAVQIAEDRVAELAPQYLPNLGAEIVVYGDGFDATEPRRVAQLLAKLGYRNLYLYRGGKRDWVNSGEFQEAMHVPPASGTRVTFSDALGTGGRPSSATSTQPKVPRFRLYRTDPRMAATGPWQPRGDSVAAIPIGRARPAFSKYLGGALAILAVYGACEVVLRLVHKRQRLAVGRDWLNTDTFHRVVRIHEDSGFEKEADSFHSATSAE